MRWMTSIVKMVQKMFRRPEAQPEIVHMRVGVSAPPGIVATGRAYSSLVQRGEIGGADASGSGEPRRYAEVMIRDAIESGHVATDPAPVIVVSQSEAGHPIVTITATLTGALHFVPIHTLNNAEEQASGASEAGFVERYFQSVEEHPDPARMLMAAGVLAVYVSNTFLDGWINYVQPLRAFLITRYRGHLENQLSLKRWLNSNEVHPRLHYLGDDVLILARAKDGTYWYFWYDCDVSDCKVGRFFSTDGDEAVSKSFERHAQATSLEMGRVYSASDCSENKDGAPALELPVATLRGWICWS